MSMSTTTTGQRLQASTSRASRVSASGRSIPSTAPIEAGHSFGTGLQLVTSQLREDHQGGEKQEGEGEDEYGRLYMLKRLRRDVPLPGRWTLFIMLQTLFLVMFLAGWNDASQGPLLPSLQSYYDVNYTIISTIWVANFGGFVTAGIVNVLLTDRLGFGIVCPIGAFAQAVGYALMCWGGPFVLFILAYIPNGFGLGLQDAQVNSLTSRLENAQTKMFLMHAVYGFGATVSPLISTEFVKSVSDSVYFYFAVSLGLALVTVLALVLVFRFKTEDQIVGRRSGDGELVQEQGQDRVTGEGSADETHQATRQETAGAGAGNGEGSGDKMKRIMKTPAVHFMAFYIMIYVGVEVTIGGWATTFILDERGGDSNAGYVTTGYFAGLTLGRIILIPVTKWLGNGNAIYIFTILAMALELVIWFTDSIPGNAVCFALVGIFLGPCYPIVVMTVVDVIPPELQGGSIGWLASLGQGGSAIMPFITGAISQHYGVWILQPLVFAFLGFSLVLWAFVVMPRWGLGNPEKIKPLIATGTIAESAHEETGASSRTPAMTSEKTTPP